MHIILTSDISNNIFFDFFKNNNFNFKFILINDIIKKLNKNYLQKSKIIYVYNIKNINFINLIKNYHTELHLFCINIQSFYLNNSSLFFFNEFLHSSFTIDNFDHNFIKNNNFILPQIIYNKKIYKKIIVTGVCKNISNYLFNSFHKFIYLNFYFKYFKIIIYENDSSDNTLNSLYLFQKIFKNIDIIILSQNNINGTITQRISHARNYILNYIHNNNLNPDFIINIDMDDILLHFYCDSIIYPFKENFNWSMFGGNSEIYYDMWALRTLSYPNKDFWENKKMHLEERLKLYFKIDNESNPIQVNSCFNGIGIYKYNDIINCYYNGNETCEHIQFHQDMIKKNNAKLFIHPKLIVGPHKILSKPMGFYKINRFVKNYI